MTRARTELEQALDGAKLSPTTRSLYKMVVRSYVRFAGARPQDWTAASIEAWRDALTVSPPAKNVYLAAVKRAARRWAALHKTYDVSAAVEGVLVPATKHPRSPTPLAEAELSSMLGTCARSDDPVDVRDRALLAVAIATGLRRAALARIECDDLDACDRSIVVIEKRNKRHRVRLSVQAWARLDVWLAWLRRRHVPTTGTSRVWRSLRRCLDAELGWCVGGGMEPDAIYRIVRRRAKRAGITTRVCTHSLRHSLVALLRERGVPEEQIAKRLGHASTSTTALYGGDIVRDGGDDGLPT